MQYDKNFKNICFLKNVKNCISVTLYIILHKIFLHDRCRQSDAERKQHQLKTGGCPPIVIDDNEEDMHERVRSIVPTINFMLENQWE